MSDSISKTVPAVIKEKKHLGAKPYVEGSCKDGFASPKANEHGGLMRHETDYDNGKVIIHYFDGTVLTMDLKK